MYLTQLPGSCQYLHYQANSQDSRRSETKMLGSFILHKGFMHVVRVLDNLPSGLG